MTDTKRRENFEQVRTGQFLEMALPEYNWGIDEHLQETPRRFLSMIRELATPVNGRDPNYGITTFKSDVNEMVVMKDIPFTAMCAHHIIPFVGSAYVAYIPNGQLVGLSKLARVVKDFARGLWNQEELTETVALFLEDVLDPLGIGVVMEAEHFCMTIRGVQSPGTMTVTSSMRGVFIDVDKRAREEFLSLIRKDL